MAKNRGGGGGTKQARQPARQGKGGRSTRPTPASASGSGSGAGAGAGLGGARSGSVVGNASTGKSPPDSESNKARHQRLIPFAAQQRLLDVFRRALGPTLASPRLDDVLQAIKKALFERDFAGAFERGQPVASEEGGEGGSSSWSPAPLDAYAARWSPTRALCYAAILSSPLLQEHWGGRADKDSHRPWCRRMVALGGGAAETVAFGALMGMAEIPAMITATPEIPAKSPVTPAGLETPPGQVVLVDAAPWAHVVAKLYDAAVGDTTTAWAARALQQDLLTMDDAAMAALMRPITGLALRPAATATLVTLFFTLNELFTAGGIGAAAAFLLRLTAATAPNTLLLVVDSPGSYAEAAVGSQARRYPMRWLLDKILLHDARSGTDDGDDTGASAWRKIHEDDAVWFRLPPGLVYPIRLEDMRYQLHLYERC